VESANRRLIVASSPDANGDEVHARMALMAGFHSTDTGLPYQASKRSNQSSWTSGTMRSPICW
jgi:hypothetical protein